MSPALQLPAHPRRWDAGNVRRMVDDYEAVLPADAWPNWVLGNHDQHRLATRVGPDQARVANMLLLTLRGTPTCYYGDELGMENVPIPLEMVQDPPAVNQPEIADIVGPRPGTHAHAMGRFPQRRFRCAGRRKSSGCLSLPEYKEVNVADQLK